MTERFGYRGYVASRPFMGERAPQHVQNLVIREYCKKKDLHYLLSATEYTMPGCFMILEQLVDEIDRLQGIVAYSLFMLPERRQARNRIYDRVLGSAATIHFAMEELTVGDAGDVVGLEDIWMVRQSLDYCPKAL